MTDDRTVSFLELQAKKPTKKLLRTLEMAPYKMLDECKHLHSVVDEELAQVTCKDCKVKLNPIWVLMRLAREESRFKERRESLQKTMDEWKLRSRTKCTNCGKMTSISR